ncbi:MAG: tetratricopeptide repeat protein [bacterium]|nr:tetratricopeptide repeat protein [bacterium]
MDEIEQRIAAGDYDCAARVLNAIDFDYLQLWGYSRIVIPLRERLLGKLTEPELIQNNSGNLGLAYSAIGRLKESITLQKQSLNLSLQRTDRQAIGVHLCNLGTAYAKSDELTKAIEYHEQALASSREIGDRRGEGHRLNNLGIAYAKSGELAKAIEYHERALASSYEIGRGSRNL